MVADNPKWTVMVFMGVANLENAADMTEEARKDLAELAAIKTHPGLNVFAQKHDANGNVERYRVDHGELGELPIGDDERDPTRGNALGKFVRACLEIADHGPTDRSILVLWGHAYQFTVGHQPAANGVESLDFGELVEVLKAIQNSIPSKYTDKRLDLVGFDACDLSLIEVANVLSPFAKYLVASEIGIPLPGWPYDRVFSRLSQTSNGNGAPEPMSPADLGTFIVRQFCGGYRDRRASLTLLDLSKAKDVFTKTEALASALARAASRDRREREVIRDLFTRSQTLPGRPFIDVADFCVNLTWHCADPEVQSAATELGDVLIRPIDNASGVPGVRIPDRLRPFVVEHGRNGHETAKLQGAALYAPHVAGPRFDWPTMKEMYDKFAPSETLWNAVIHAFAS